MNECRLRAAATVVNGKIFCSEHNSVEYYDPSSDVWTIIDNMPQYTTGHGAVEMDGYFIIMGGWDNKTFFNNVWALNTTDKNAVWITKPPMSIPRSDFSITKIDGKIFICGGVFKSMGWHRTSLFKVIVNDVEIFDGKVWSNGPKLPSHRYSTAAVVIPMEFAKHLIILG